MVSARHGRWRWGSSSHLSEAFRSAPGSFAAIHLPRNGTCRLRNPYSTACYARVRLPEGRLRLAAKLLLPAYRSYGVRTSFKGPTARYIGAHGNCAGVFYGHPSPAERDMPVAQPVQHGLLCVGLPPESRFRAPTCRQVDWSQNSYSLPTGSPVCAPHSKGQRPDTLEPMATPWAPYGRVQSGLKARYIPDRCVQARPQSHT